MIPLRYNLRSLAVRKTTTVATALGIGLVVFVLAASQMLADGIRNTLGRAGEPDHAIVLRKGSDNEMSSNLEARVLNLILAAPGVKRGPGGVPRGVGELLAIIALEKPHSGGQVSNVAVRGGPAGVLQFRKRARIVAGRVPRPGADEAIIGKRLRGQFAGLQLGQRFELKKNLELTVVGVFEAAGSSHESEIWCDLQLVASAFGREGYLSSVTVQLTGADRLDTFRSAVEHDRQLGLMAEREPVYYEKQSEGTATLVRFLGGAVTFFFSIGAIIGAMITMYAAVAHRRREVGTLRALGFSRGTILSSFLLESVLLALIGGAAGAAGSLCMGLVEFSMMNFNSWSEITFSFDPSPQIVLGALAAGGLMGVLGGLLPALRAARTSPVEAMRD
jgi:putative ABC transport system permease protein